MVFAIWGLTCPTYLDPILKLILSYLIDSNSIVTVELELYICKTNPCTLTEFEIIKFDLI